MIGAAEQASIEAVLTNYGQIVDMLKAQNQQFRAALAGLNLDAEKVLTPTAASPREGVLPNVPATYQKGTVTFSPVPETWNAPLGTCVFGLQATPDGRVWVCVNGHPLIRFSPHADGEMSARH